MLLTNNRLIHKTLIVFLAMVLVLMTLNLKRASANPLAAVFGGIEIGALAMWGGAALAAAAGTAVGLDDDLMDDVEQWGKDVWDNANQAIKNSITATLGGMAAGDANSRYNVQWFPDTAEYLKEQWELAFGSTIAIDQGGIIKSALTMFPYGVIPNYFTNGGSYFVLTQTKRFTGDAGWYTYWSFNVAPNVATKGPDLGTNQETYEYAPATPQAVYTQYVYSNCAVNAYPCHPGAMGWSDLYGNASKGFSTVTNPSGSFTKLVYTNFDITNGAGSIVWSSNTQSMVYPVSNVFPDSLSLPAPRGEVDGAGNPVYEKPKIGRIGAAVGAGVAVGYVSNLADLTIADAISQTQPGTNNPTKPREDWPDTMAQAITTRFPFSLPWDIAYLINIFVAPPQVPIIDVDVGPIDFTVSLDKIDPYMPFIRGILIAFFLYGLVMKTRSLLGGGK